MLDELLEKIKTALSTAETEEVVASVLRNWSRETPTRMEFAELVEKGGKGSVDRNYLFEAYRGAILFSGQTWWKMGLGSAYRTLTAPIAEFALIAWKRSYWGCAKMPRPRRAGLLAVRRAQFGANADAAIPAERA